MCVHMCVFLHTHARVCVCVVHTRDCARAHCSVVAAVVCARAGMRIARVLCDCTPVFERHTGHTGVLACWCCARVHTRITVRVGHSCSRNAHTHARLREPSTCTAPAAAAPVLRAKVLRAFACVRLVAYDRRAARQLPRVVGCDCRACIGLMGSSQCACVRACGVVRIGAGGQCTLSYTPAHACGGQDGRVYEAAPRCTPARCLACLWACAAHRQRPASVARVLCVVARRAQHLRAPCAHVRCSSCVRSTATHGVLLARALACVYV